MVRYAEARDGFAIELRYLRRSPRTIETYLRAVDSLLKDVGDVPLIEVTREHIKAYTSRFHPTTANQRHRSLRVFFNWAVSEGILDRSPMEGLKTPRPAEAVIEVIAESDFRRLLAASRTSLRDQAVLWLLWDTGVRVGELTSIQRELVDLKEMQVQVSGKTGTRVVPFTPGTGRALERYFRSLKDSEEENPFFGVRQTVGRMLAKRAREAKVSHVHPHQFRHSAAHRFLALGMNEGEVMTILGWKDRSMLDRYGRSMRAERAINRYRELVV